MAVNGVAQQLNDILDQYADKLDKRTDDIMETVSKETADDLKQTSPKRKGGKGGAYARSWTVTKDKRKHTYTVHNKKHYRLTHLLENGHAVRNQYGDYTPPVKGKPHIYEAEQRAIKKLINKLEAEL